MKRKVLIWTLIMIIPMIFLILYGCGSSRKGADRASAGIPYAGITNCYNCHADGLLARYPKLFSTWLNGPHGNDESIDPNHQHVDLHPENTGFPSYGYSGLGTDPACSTVCHDPTEDGLLLETLYLAFGIDALGRENRPIVGCESCHGPGGNHYGIGPLGIQQPGSAECGECHNSVFPESHLPFHPEGAMIYEVYTTSPHARSINEHTYAEGSLMDVQAKCARCHTHEGAMRYIRLANGTEGYSEIGTLLDDKPNIEGALPIQCHTCHDPHDPFKFLSARATGLPASWSEEFKTCTACHQLLKADGSIQTVSYHDPNANPHGDPDEIITDTHYNYPSTGEIEGYIVDPNAVHNAMAGNSNSGGCLDCHDPHDADNTINLQWAESGHGNLDGEAWGHYDFKGSDRIDCQACHTATGFRNFASDPNSYDPNNNEFVATGQQKEVLYCWACHVSYTGNLRDPGPFAQTAPYTVPAERITSVPDLSGSNMCMTCHSGRESGDGLKDPNLVIAGENFGSFNSHYLPAGGILFRTIGYEFSGRDYDNVAYFEHDLIGSDAAPGTGSNGPCVGCHMRTSDGHNFIVVEKDPNGLITGIKSDEQSCATCHTGEYALTIMELNELDEGYEASLEALKGQLAANGIYYGTEYPYFYSDPNTQNSDTRFTAWPDKDTLGAAFNLNMFLNMPGAYVHNRFYTKRLIYDTIDFLDDDDLNASVEATLGSGPACDFLEGTRTQASSWANDSI